MPRSDTEVCLVKVPVQPYSEDDDLAALSEDVRRRQWRTRGPQPLANSINQLLARRGYAQVETSAACAEAWAAAAGPELAAASQAGEVRRGTLEITVQNSAVLQELTFRKTELLRKLTALVPDQKIRQLKRTDLLR